MRTKAAEPLMAYPASDSPAQKTQNMPDSAALPAAFQAGPSQPKAPATAGNPAESSGYTRVCPAQRPGAAQPPPRRRKG